MLRGDTVFDDSGAYAVFTEQGSSASQMTAAKVIDVIATTRMRFTSSGRNISLWISENQHHFSTMYIWDVLNERKCKPNHVILLEQPKSYQGGRNLTQRQSHGLATWKDMLESASRDIVNWQIERLSNCTKFQLNYLHDHNFKLENCDQITQSSSRRPRCVTQKMGKGGSIAGNHSEMRTSGASSVDSKIRGKNAK